MAGGDFRSGIGMETMSDDLFKTGEGGRSDGGGNRTSGTRHSTGTENLGAVFDLFSNSRRRYLLEYLFTVAGDVVEFEAAVNAVYKYETAGTEAGDYSSRENVEIALHHNHLPRLANEGILDYDRRHGTIRFTGHPTLEDWVEHGRLKELE